MVRFVLRGSSIAKVWGRLNFGTAESKRINGAVKHTQTGWCEKLRRECQ